MQNRFRHSELELRGPTNDLRSGPRSSRGVHSAPFYALSPMAVTRSTLGGRKAPRTQQQAVRTTTWG
eukprot:15476435-Alexandrium_andersonii.AAC.1